jgi:integrase
MPLELIPPGKRKGNRYYIARGTIAGRQFEVSTKTTDKDAAERFAAQFTTQVLESGGPEATEQQPLGPANTFKEAAGRYLDLHPGETTRLRPIIRDIGHFALATISQADIVASANRLCRGQKASSKNRKVVTSISSVMHYAHENGWCDYLKIKRFKEEAPATRAVRRDPAEKLIEGADGKMKVLLIFLFGQGMRITDALQLTWERLDLTEGLIYVRVGKSNEWRWKALQPDVRVALAGLVGDRQGFVFPWQSRWGVYRQLKKVRKKTGINFTPHMARHSLGTWLGQNRASLKTIMDIMDHADERSSMRYQMTELPEQRAALDLLGSIGQGRKKKEAS